MSLKTIRHIFILLVYSIALINCSEGTGVREIKLVPSISANQLDDSTFISKTVNEINYYKGLIYFSDSFNSRVIVLDSNFILKRIIGKPGQGPGELNNAFNFAFYKDSIYIIDNEKQINVFTINGIFARRFRLEKYPDVQFKFAISQEGNIYISSRIGEKPIQVYNLGGNLINQFGDWIFENHDYLKLTCNTRFLFINDSELISVLMSAPFIEIYDLYGNIKRKIDLSECEQIEERLTTVRENQENKKNNPPRGILTWDILFTNAYLVQDDLFLLYEIPYKQYSRSNNVLIINLKDSYNKVNVNLTLETEQENSNFSDICVFSNSLISFDTIHSRIHKFNLDEIFGQSRK